MVIPCYNEVDSLPRLFPVMSEIKKKEEYGVLFVDDGSTDGTGKMLAESGFKENTLTGNVNRGKTWGLLAGAKYAKENGFDIMVVVDADSQNLTEKKEENIAMTLRLTDGSGRPRFAMTVADIDEGYGNLGREGALAYSGQRGFRVDVFDRYWNKKEMGKKGRWTEIFDDERVRWPEPGFKLLIPRVKTCFLGNVVVKQREPHRGDPDEKTDQYTSLDRTFEIHSRRKEVAETYRDIADHDERAKTHKAIKMLPPETIVDNATIKRVHRRKRTN